MTDHETAGRRGTPWTFPIRIDRQWFYDGLPRDADDELYALADAIFENVRGHLPTVVDAHIPRVADGPFIAACSCGWRLTGQPVEDGGDEWLAHAATQDPLDEAWKDALASRPADTWSVNVRARSQGTWEAWAFDLASSERPPVIRIGEGRTEAAALHDVARILRASEPA